MSSPVERGDGESIMKELKKTIMPLEWGCTSKTFQWGEHIPPFFRSIFQELVQLQMYLNTGIRIGGMLAAILPLNFGAVILM